MADAMAAHRPVDAFDHQALLYSGEREFVARVAGFVREGMRASEPVLVMSASGRIDLLRAELGHDADGVSFQDMAVTGRNPAWIIPAWSDFVAEHGDDGVPVRGVGEPVTTDREPDEVVERERHEALLNLAFAGGPPWKLACPYDVRALTPETLRAAGRSHPFVLNGGRRRPSPTFAGAAALSGPLAGPLPEPAGPTARITFVNPSSVRRFVAEVAAELGAGPRTEDLVLASSEIATNSIRYGGGSGDVRLWRESGAVVCEIRDAGRIDDPLAGRRRPGAGASSGFGLWIANRVCDLVQMRSAPSGTVTRLRVAVGS